MRTLTKVATAVSSIFLMGAAVTAQADITGSTPSAYAESTLNVTNFQITLGDGSSLLPLLNTQILNLKANVQSTVSANLNGGSDATAASVNPLANTTPAPSISINASVGPGYAGYPFVSYPVNTLAPTTFAGSASEHSGNALMQNGNPATTALTQAQVNINNSASIGHADSRQNLATTYELDITAPLTFLVSFEASAFARIALGQPEVIAQIDRNWGIDVRDVSNPLSPVLLMSWEPDGGAGNALSGTCTLIAACSEVNDAFNLNLQAAIQNTGDFQLADGPGLFGVLVTLPAGSYQLAINHDVSADAQAIPEPGSLALLGVALTGLAALRRKSKKA